MGWLERIAEEEARQRRLEVVGGRALVRSLRWVPRLWLVFAVVYVIGELVR